MSTAARLSAYGAVVVLLGAVAFVAGATLGAPTGHLRPAAADTGPPPAPPPVPAETPGGLATSENGYTLVPATTTLPAGTPTELAFHVNGPDGRPVTAFDVAHEKRLHLILVRRDTAGFQHLHPTMSADGTWRTPVTLAGAGTYRAFADIAPTGGTPTTLGVDLFVPGEFSPVDPQPNRRATAPGGYEVTLDGELVPGRPGDVTLTVTRNGAPVTDLQPYLGAFGHLVALRGGDLGYLHVHPDGAPGDGRTAPGPAITFHAEVPSAGSYRLFLDFRHDDEVRTVQFTVPTAAGHPTGGAPATVPAPEAPAPEAPGHEHAEGGH
ncbi:hypothetical protein SAMN05216207_101634 [Pseudonocardia ammonioxydans]|uniref:Secreted protein n=1 Tax=Pseudonocardia ammonioxydans TaxID=260086 RepID=A0A1I4ZVV3_PSUAM|nr:hypothetical protein [Pseudonocardia ammonioxydans]SFN54109.1 hypothetical protein SAMN05216207_101634 [Pseudonocardia ammonioxydans]